MHEGVYVQSYDDTHNEDTEVRYDHVPEGLITLSIEPEDSQDPLYCPVKRFSYIVRGNEVATCIVELNDQDYCSGHADDQS